MDRLKQIESFVAVATKGSLTASALAEGVAPAVIGRRIDALEERLGVKLLRRTTRRITLTHEGSAFLEDCQRLLADLASAEASVSAGGVKASGHLRITAPAGFGRRHVAPLVPRFRAAHPDVSVSLNLSDRVVDIVNEGFDCAVRVGDLPDSSLISVRLADNRRLCVASPDYLQREGTPASPAELARLRHGLSLDGKPLKPAEVEWENAEQLRFVLREGKKRQIRRMCEQVGLKVVGLKRIRMGRVTLGRLPPGQWRYLGRDERF